MLVFQQQLGFLIPILSLLLLFWHAPLGVRSAIRRHQPPQRAVLSQVSGFVQCKAVGCQVSLPFYSAVRLWYLYVLANFHSGVFNFVAVMERAVICSCSFSCQSFIMHLLPSDHRRWSLAFRGPDRHKNLVVRSSIALTPHKNFAERNLVPSKSIQEAAL